MKRTALLSFALGALCAHAQAQDNVTLYGIIDAGINYVSNVRGTNGGGSSQFALTSGPMQGSRWGIKGSEDLGGGLKAIFTLENGFTVNTGTAAQGGTEFGRQAFVGLSGAFGKVTLGRQYDMGVDFVAPYTANRYLGYFAAHPDDLDNLNQTVRLNNSIKYVSPEYHGLSAGIVYAFGGKPGSVSTQQIVSLGVHYANGPLGLGLAYLNARNPNLSMYGNTAGAASANTNFIGANPVFAGYASARTLQIIVAGGSYQFGRATLNMVYSNTQFRGLGDLASGPNPLGYTGTATFNNAEIGMKYRVTPAIAVGAAYDYTRGSGASGMPGVTYHQVNAGVDYFLSKRTDLYALAGYQHASGSDSTNPQASAVATLTNLTPAAGDKQAVVRVGMRHTF